MFNTVKKPFSEKSRDHVINQFHLSSGISSGSVSFIKREIGKVEKFCARDSQNVSKKLRGKLHGRGRRFQHQKLL